MAAASGRTGERRREGGAGRRSAGRLRAAALALWVLGALACAGGRTAKLSELDRAEPAQLTVFPGSRPSWHEVAAFAH